jgi:DNA repair protein RecO (recombination protein O)
MSLYRDEAIVIRTYKLGEADRIVVLFTKGKGKVRTVAKGVRKTTSRFGSRLEPTSHVALQLYEGRQLDTITQAESIDHFRAIREDLDRFARASAMLEATDHIMEEREPNPRLFTMLLGALRTLAAQNHPLIVPGFFWKLLTLEGFAPLVDACAVCGAEDALVAFDIDDGGVLCTMHRKGTALSADAIQILQLMLGGRLAAALTLEPSAAAIDIEHLATRVMEHHLERKLRSVGVLDRG